MLLLAHISWYDLFYLLDEWNIVFNQYFSGTDTRLVSRESYSNRALPATKDMRNELDLSKLSLEELDNLEKITEKVNLYIFVY